MKGVLENIQHYCIHDGPGIRTVVFLKGCPLRCRWCSNPTTQEHKPELLYHADKCFSCGHCAEICPQRAVTREGEAVIFDRALCDGCGLCAKECPGKALQIAGVERNTADVLEDIKKDMAFYRKSGGGVTLSGTAAGFCESLFFSSGAGLLRIIISSGENGAEAYSQMNFGSFSSVKLMRPCAQTEPPGAKRSPYFSKTFGKTSASIEPYMSSSVTNAMAEPERVTFFFTLSTTARTSTYCSSLYWSDSPAALRAISSKRAAMPAL